MHPDELNKPLGLDANAHAHRREIPWSAIAFGGLAILGAGVFAFARLTEPPQPDAAANLSSITPISSTARPHGHEPDRRPGVSFDDATGSIHVPARASANEVEGASGVRVVRQGGAAAPGALIITIPAEGPDRKGRP